MQEVRVICVKVLGGELGLKVISKMANLCRFLIWENTILTTLAEATHESVGNLLGHEDFLKLTVRENSSDTKPKGFKNILEWNFVTI